MQKNILVVTPTLGNRITLQRTVNSVRKIGKVQVKHVIVAPHNAINQLQKEYPDVECIAEPNDSKGIYSALNYAFYKYGHEYEYITFINDDDYWLPEYRYLIDTILKNHSIDLIYGRTIYIDENNKQIGEQTSSNQFKSFIPLLKNNIILLTQQATIIKSHLFFKVGGFDESYILVADTKFWAELSKLRIKYKYTNKECAAYMLQEGQLSSNIDISHNEHDRLYKEYSSNYLNIQWQTLIFRIINFPIYIKRFIQLKKIRNPFNRDYTKKIQ